MRRFLKEHALELRFFLYLTLWVTTLSIWQKQEPQRPIFQILILVAFIATAVLTVVSWKKLWREQLRGPIFNGIRGIFVKIARFTMRFMGYFERFGGRGNVINGKTSVSYDLFAISKSKRGNKVKRARTPRWKDMKTPRERLGYLYYYTVSAHLKRGERVTAQETPNEIASRLAETESEREMFALYKETRYDDRKIVDDEKVIRLKDELFDN